VKEVEQKTELLVLSNHKTLGDYLVVVPVNISQSGITTKQVQYEDRPSIGIVASVGLSVSNINEGDVVFFGQYSNDSITHDGVQYLLIRQEDIYCVAENN
jgi:co-chaperonin GroES (HSP10)